MWVVYTVLSKGVGESRRLPISSDATLHARYEGTLSHVDAENSCVTLDNVKSWGTEGRTSKDAEFAEEMTLLGSVEFRGQDIRDLQVHRIPQIIISPSQKSPQQQTGSTHAVQSASTTPSTTVKEPTSGLTAAAEEPKFQSDSEPKSYPAPRTKAWKYQPPHKKKQDREPREGHRNAGPVAAQSKTYSGNRGGARKKNTPGITVSKKDFDFQGALAEFEKDAEMAKFFREGEELESCQNVGNQEGGGASVNGSGHAVVVKKYDKNSFFDELSCDALRGRTRTTRQKERELNTETFGEADESYRGRSYRGRGGRRGHGNWRNTRGGQGSRLYNIHQPRNYRNSDATKNGSNNQQNQD